MPVPVVTEWESLPLLLTVQHLRELTGLSRDLCYELPYRPGFPSVKLGRRIFILRDDLRAWLARQAGGSAR
jgi:predicted DNA-binding transcriptional regulator AlpA